MSVLEVVREDGVASVTADSIAERRAAVQSRGRSQAAG